MKIAIGIRLQGFSAPGSMGVVQDTLFVNCFWPKLDRPIRIFAEGSIGVHVMGTTPRNVWFPDDVVFEPYYPDALYSAEQAVKKAFPYRIGLINLSPAEAQVWWDAYQAAVASFPPTHTIVQTSRHVNFLRHREVVRERSVTLKEDSVSGDTFLKAGSVVVKRDYEEYVAELTPQEAVDLVDGKLNETALREEKRAQFVRIDNPDVKLVDDLAARVR